MRARYGAGPLHLIGHLAMLAVLAFAVDQILSGGGKEQLFEWFIGFALLHDLVLLPLYTALDRLATSRLPRRPAPLVNYVRVPALISAVLLLVYAPLITRVGDSTYFFYSGHHVHGYLRNWLLITAGLFLASGCVYAARAWRGRTAHG